MSYTPIYNQLKLILQGLEYQVEQERKEEERRRANNERPMMYRFIYEQFFTDIEEWGPSDQLVEAYSLREAFATLGNLIESFPLKVRNIRYGTYDETEEEHDSIRAYWKKYWAEHPDHSHYNR